MEKKELIKNDLIDLLKDNKMSMDVHGALVSYSTYQKKSYTYSKNIVNKEYEIEAMKKEDARFELLQRTIIGFEQTKVSAGVFGKEMDDLKDTLHRFDLRLDDLRDSQKSMQNWIEKYEPLKVQHQITDTLAVCINRKARIKLAEYDLGKCAQLREGILTDHGVPSIREKILDLLTQIEKES